MQWVSEATGKDHMKAQLDRESNRRPTRSRPVMHSDCPSAVLGMAAAERLAATLDRTVTALESLLIAMDRGEFHDVKCLAKTLINDLGFEEFMLRERLARFQPWHVPGLGSTDMRDLAADGLPICQTPRLPKVASLNREVGGSAARRVGEPALDSRLTP